MMVRFLLDTNILSELIKPRIDQEVEARFRRDGGACAISAVTWHEVVHGTRRTPSRNRGVALLNAYRTLLQGARIEVLPYDAQAAEWHGQERARLSGLGRPLPYPDSQIAAVAATRDLTLVTRNTRDFDCFQGLSLENWFDAGNDELP